MSRTATIARFEFVMQSREFLSGIYVAVFFLLTFFFTSSHGLELVRDRGELARNGSLILAEAMAGVTAFGAVITTMIASTAVMRDSALRTEALILTTRLSAREYLLGRFSGALGVMLLVYVAIPLGLLLGTAVPWAPRSELVPFNTTAYVRPVALLLVPNVIAVAAIFFAVGALARNFFAILLAGIVLVSLWQLGLSLVHTSDTAILGALIDPFGNAALANATRSIVGVARTTTAMPLDPTLLANRALWLAIGMAALGTTLARFRFALAPALRGGVIGLASSAADARTSRTAPAAAGSPSEAHTPPTPLRRSSYVGHWGRQLDAQLRFTFVSTIREKGFIALCALALLNGITNAWTASGTAAHVKQDAVLLAVAEHTRLFFVLVATIWAGELVWRERDLRADGLRDALPMPSSATVIGKLVGVHGAQALMVAMLGVVAFVLPRLRGAPQAPTAWFTIGWSALAVLPTVALLTQLSLAVHAVVQHKVAGHVLCIAGWVGSAALGANHIRIDWLALNDVPRLSWDTMGGVTIDWPAQARDVAFNLLRGAGWTVLAIAAWSRGVRRPLFKRIAGTAARG